MLISRIEKYTHDTKFDLIINVNLNLHFLIYFPLFGQNSFDYFITSFIIVLISVSLHVVSDPNYLPFTPKYSKAI